MLAWRNAQPAPNLLYDDAMEWTDEGLVLGTRRHGESSVVLELMTREHGRHLGIVRGGRAPRHAAVLQAGNGVRAVWRARLDEHLGNFAIELSVQRTADLMGSAIGLNAVQTLAAHLRLLPEREPHAELLDAVEAIMLHLDAPALVGELVVRFELAILDALGFGLDLASCALTGDRDGLAYVSPKSGRAATAAAAGIHAPRLLRLPPFLTGRAAEDPRGWGGASPEAIRDGFRLTGHFLARHVWEPRSIEPPAVRDALAHAIERAARAA
jgi:DNA repair protein RecO (recombination protein O)